MARTVRHVLVEVSGDSDFAGLIEADDTLEQWWAKVMRWPPDVFAVTSTLLGESGGYRRAVSPPTEKRWPPRKTWDKEIRARAEKWWRWVHSLKATPDARPPRWLAKLGSKVRAAADNPVIGLDDRWEAVCALLELHALADEASGGFGVPPHSDEDSRPSEWKAYRLDASDLLGESDSLSHFSKELIRVLPKMRTPQAGITLRSLSSNLAAIRHPEVDVRWASVSSFRNAATAMNVLLLPVPFSVRPQDFRPKPGVLDNMDKKLFGFFAFEPGALDINKVTELLTAAAKCSGGVDGVVLPELAVSRTELVSVQRAIEQVFQEHQPHHLPFLLAGVRGDRDNRAYLSVWEGTDWRVFEQGKHHRWCLDRSQILAYEIGAALHPSVRWWEDISVDRRTLQFVLLNSWLGICPLICEDLARQDPVAQIVRALGPTIVIALLLDGPQLKGRWPARYATVLADDPGSSVLTFTPLGMSIRSVPEGESPKRVVGLWKDSKNGVRELALAPDAHALLVTLCNEWTTEWTADGRSDRGAAAQLYLGHVEQLK